MAYEGTTVGGRFQIENLAGKGGMGSVYRAHDRQTGGEAALKILNGETTQSHRDRFAREAKLLAELTIPAVVRHLAHGLTERGEQYLAMEWLDGEDLAARLRREALGAGEAVHLVRRIAEALGAAHARGIVHRDIKPSNLFLVDSNVERVKVLDFGIAHVQAARDAMTRTGATIGTPGYMAPEQARGSRDLDTRADVFSLGCVLFECLAGQPPFVGDSSMAVLAKILLEDAPRISTVRDDLPQALDDLIARMLTKDPKGRPRDGTIVAAALEALGEITDARGSIVKTRDSAVSVGEQRLVCVVFAREAIAPAAASVETAQTLADAAPPTMPDAAVGTARTAFSGGVGVLPALSAAVAAHGGRAEVLADGSVVVTVFGEGAATDQAARSARCALAVRAVVPGSAMALAIGRSRSGDNAPLGDLIDRAASLLREQVTATGPTMAIPIQPEVRPIRVDEVAAGLLDIRFVIEGDDAGLVLAGERDVADGGRTLLGRPTSCVGRERELAALGATFDECVAEPMAHVVVVTAAAGVGKSRLRHEFLQRLDPTVVEIWIGRGNPMSAGAPFAILAQALRRTAGIVEGEPLHVRLMKLKARVQRNVPPDEAPRIVEFLAELIGAPLAEPASVQLKAARQDPQLMGDQMLRACEDFIAIECAARPLVLVLEDLHWGDLPTVRFVDAVVRQLPDRPLMVFALARPEVDVTFPRLWSERNPERIHLGELTRRAAEKLASEALGRAKEDPLIGRIVERAAGNAFYLEELIRAVSEGKGDRLPETVIAMAQARIESLEVEARHVLRAAAIFGQTFWRGGVTTLLDGGTTHVDDWLDELVRRELITARRDTRFAGEAEYTFRHSLVREAAYAMLTDRDRTRGHRLAGEWLEAHIRAERPLERAAEAEAVALAEHFERGGNPQRSISWYRQAAEQALEANDLGAAIERADRAIACIDASGSTEDSDLVGVLRQLQAGAHDWRGEYELAELHGEEAMARLPPAGAAWLLAAASVMHAYALRLEQDKLTELCVRLVDLPIAPGTYRAYAHVVALGVPSLLYSTRDATLTERLFARLDQIELAAVGADVAALAWIFHARSWRAMRDGDLGGCLVLDTRVVECFTVVGDLRHACQQRANVAYDELNLGAHRNAEASFLETIATATRIGLPQVIALAQHNLGLALARQGKLDEARHVETISYNAMKAHGNHRLAASARGYLALIELIAGNFELAKQHAGEAIEATVDMPVLRCHFHATMSTACRLAGDPISALSHARTAMQLIETHGSPEEGEAEVRLAYAEALHATGAVQMSRRVIEDAESRVLAMAAKIRDPDWRRSFLEEIPVNAMTLARARLLR
ncbi:MAG: protein kinase [Myxococcales bacterium]|nr:protein kinase [Myxococcales bacterium]